MDLQRCLMSLVQLDYAVYEIIVVCNSASRLGLDQWCYYDHLKVVDFEEANISKVRNAGITAAAGDWIAFIDDDSAAEPTWLAHFADALEVFPNVGALTGYVRGRNGISFQRKAAYVDAQGFDHPVDFPDMLPVLADPASGCAPKTEGTNMAFRRDILIALGGFDPNFKYFLDEPDLNMRLTQAGYTTCFVPLAQVHHGYMENATRSRSRVPKSLAEIGASTAVFIRKFTDENQREKVLAAHRDATQARVLRYMQSGVLDAPGVRRLMREYERGLLAGMAREISPFSIGVKDALPFKQVNEVFSNMELIAKRGFPRKEILKLAHQTVEEGRRVTVFCFSRTTLFHKVQFGKKGFWLHTGGQFGKRERFEQLFKIRRFKALVESEKKRISPTRGIKYD